MKFLRWLASLFADDSLSPRQRIARDYRETFGTFNRYH